MCYDVSLFLLLYTNSIKFQLTKVTLILLVLIVIVHHFYFILYLLAFLVFILCLLFRDMFVSILNRRLILNLMKERLYV